MCPPPSPCACSNLCPMPPDLLQVEVTKAYLAKQVDEITLQQADVVLILEQEDGKQRSLLEGKGKFIAHILEAGTSRVCCKPES